MPRLATITGDFQAIITHIALSRGNLDRSLVILGVNTVNTEEMERRIAEEGFTLKYRLRNG